ncbi:MAG: DNA primase [Chloroflexi bacterium]|nr:DNA primase [Chloroflexota bacterium]
MSVIDEVKQRLDIVDTISSYVQLRKAGRNYKGLCPFHSEKTPSFVVFPDTQTWHCFGACGTGGDILQFVMRREGIEFGEALRMLAERAGVMLHPLDHVELEERDEAERRRAANAAAADYYHRQLLDSPAAAVARAYLERRGVTRASMDAFQLGYAPDEWHALENALTRAKHTPQDLAKAGLTTTGEGGNVYDRFRGRLMFPIRDAQGKVIGFGARVLDDSLPKYINTPTTPLFDKGSVLYGIDLARESIRQSGTVIIVEGYMDVVIPHQCGATNLVACMGTALTDAHVKVLKRITKTMIFALDPDQAGLRAVERGVEVAREGLERKVVPVLSASGMVRYEDQLNAQIKVLTLPDKMDPDELILHDRQRWDRLVAEAKPVADYFLELVTSEVDLTTAAGKREAADRLLPVFAAMDSAVERAHYVQRLAQRLRVAEGELFAQVTRLRDGLSSRSAAQRPAAPAAKPAGRQAFGLEERCLALLWQDSGLLPVLVSAASLDAEVFSDSRNRACFETLAGASGSGQAADALDSELRAHVESLLLRLKADPPLQPEEAREDAVKCALRLRRDRMTQLLRELRFVLQDAQEQDDPELVRSVQAQIEALGRAQLQLDRQAHAATLAGRKEARERKLAGER